MPSVVMNVIYGFIALSLLILVHELGHYLVARLANVKVLAFSLGFGKKLINFKKGETEYAISAVPPIREIITGLIILRPPNINVRRGPQVTWTTL